MVVIGKPTHPQVLFTGFEDTDPGFAAMSALVPTARLLADGEMNDLRAVEWDIVVSRETDVDAPDHMHVLALGCERVGLAKTSRGGSTVFYGGKQPSEILHVADDLPDAVRRLVVGELVPWLQAQPFRPFLMTSIGSGLYGTKSVGFGRRVESSANPATLPQGLVALVRDADGNMIAGGFERYGGGWCWALPYVPKNPELWFATALSDWHERTPDKVPALPDWRSRVTWATPRETTSRADLAALRDERLQLLTDLDARETALRSAEMAAIAAADAGPRRLLTAQGDKLVDAVTDALETLGYTVANIDNEESTSGQPKVEDLRLSDPDEPGRTNITEVRGYTGGAKVSDLQRLARFAALYLLRTGALPTTRWYVVNQFINTDPDTRRRPLAGSEDDLSVFAEDGGLVIDTRDLFHLAHRVDDGGMSGAAARALLRRATGVLPMPPETSDET
jgi:hypothetical protein